MKGKKRILGLDGLKGLAILGVTLYHLYPSSLKGGYLGVTLFFVITGYLLSYSADYDFHVVRYFLKRIKRIYPALLIVLLTTCGVCYFVSPLTLSGIKSELLSIVGGYNNWWQIQQNADYFKAAFNTSPFTHLWFLGIEIQYYLIFPFIFLFYWLFKKKRIKVFTIGMGILIVISAALMPVYLNNGYSITRLYYGTDTRIYALLIGTVLGFLCKPEQNKGFKSAIQFFLFIGLFALTVFSFIVFDGQSTILYQGGMIGMTIVFAIMVVLVIKNQKNLAKLWELQPIKWLGKHSYGLFLWQYPIIYLFTQCHLNKIPCYSILEIVILLVLTILMDFVIDGWSHFKKERHKILCIVLSLVLAVFMGFGGYGIYTATDEKEKATLDLSNQLQKNLEEIKSRHISEANVVMVGDSVLLAASPYVFELFPDAAIDAEVGRHMGETIGILQSYSDQGLLGDTVVIAMGTNGPVYEDMAYEVIQFCGDRDMFWVNNYDETSEWVADNNAFLNQLAAQYDNIYVVDWYTLATLHQEYLDLDGIHPNEEGSRAYAQLLKDTMDQADEEALKN